MSLRRVAVSLFFLGKSEKDFWKCQQLVRELQFQVTFFRRWCHFLGCFSGFLLTECFLISWLDFSIFLKIPLFQQKSKKDENRCRCQCHGRRWKYHIYSIFQYDRGWNTRSIYGPKTGKNSLWKILKICRVIRLFS